MVTNRKDPGNSGVARPGGKQSLIDKFKKQPTWLRVLLIVVAIVLLPTVLGLVVGLIKLVVKGVKGLVSKIKKPAAPPADGDEPLKPVA